MHEKMSMNKQSKLAKTACRKNCNKQGKKNVHHAHCSLYIARRSADNALTYLRLGDLNTFLIKLLILIVIQTQTIFLCFLQFKYKNLFLYQILFTFSFQ